MKNNSSCNLFFIFAAFSLFLGGCALIGKKEDVSFTKNPCIVLALPGSGPYAGISAKIRKGAGIAQQGLQSNEINARIEYVNTDQPAWLTAMENLPEECAVVGGPLREKAYLEAQKSGLLEKRAFFSFMPALKGADEGLRAWRFFPSPDDQIEALIKFAAEDLHAGSFGAFYPSDAYGNKMVNLLEKALAQRHIPLEKASYNPKDSSAWTKNAAILVKPAFLNKSRIPNTSFEVLFVPDSWKNLDKIMASFMANGEDRLIWMGPTLWEQNLSGKNIPNAQNYILAVFPGAWNKTGAPKALQNAEHDFWSALGYDFINFAANLGLRKRLPAERISAQARNAAAAVQALAPISYDGSGIAHEKLHIFQISSSGMKLANAEELRGARKRAQENAALRIQKLREQAEEIADYGEASQQTVPGGTPAVMPESAEPSVMPVSPLARPAAPQTSGSTPLSTTPQPSYKLRLPVKR